MDNLYILIIIIFFASTSKYFVKFLENMNKKLPKDINVKPEHIILVFIAVAIIYLTMINKKDDFSNEEDEGGFFSLISNYLSETTGAGDYLEGSTTEPIEHEHPAGPRDDHSHGKGKSPTMIRHSHIIESPTVTPEPM